MRRQRRPLGSCRADSPAPGKAPRRALHLDSWRSHRVGRAQPHQLRETVQVRRHWGEFLEGPPIHSKATLCLA